MNHGHATEWKIREVFSYCGKEVKIKPTKDGHKATITIEGKKFNLMMHMMGEPEDNFLSLWMCDEAYIMFETLEQAAKYFIDYWYQHKN